MGKKLVLVILVSVIVGIAIIVTIKTFGTSSDQANREAVRQDLLGAAVQAQGIWSRPQLMDGAGRNFQNIDSNAEMLEMLKIPSNSEFDGTTNSLTNVNGSYSITDKQTQSIQIEGVPSGGSGVIVLDLIRNEETGNWEVLINNEDQNDIEISEENR